MARYHGGKAHLYLSATGTGTAVASIALSKWSLSKDTDKVDVTAFGDTNKQYVQGLPDVKGSISGWFDDTNDALFDASESTDGVKLYLYPSTLAPTVYHYGPAWLDASIDVPVSGAISISGNFMANGSWGRKP
jgi:hypothetical protein